MKTRAQNRQGRRQIRFGSLIQITESQLVLGVEPTHERDFASAKRAGAVIPDCGLSYAEVWSRNAFV